MSAKLTQQTYPKAPRLTPCPQRLKRIIDALDLLPAEADLPDLSYLAEEPAEAVHSGLSACLKQFPKAFSKHLWATSSYGAYSKYASMFVGTEPSKAREKLVKRMIGTALPTKFKNEAETKATDVMRNYVANTYESIVGGALTEYRYIQQSGKNLRELGRAARECRKAGTTRLTSYSAYFGVSIDQNGVAHTLRNTFGEAVDGEDLSRVGECEGCGRIFWAGRSDAICCSTPCHTSVRKKLSRYLREKGYPAGVKLTPKEEEEKAKLISAWHAQRTGKS